MALQSNNMNLTEPLAPNAEWVHESSAQVGFSLCFLLFVLISMFNRYDFPQYD